LVLTRATMPAGQVRKTGMAGGFHLKKTGAWRLTFTRHSLKFLKRIETIAPTAVDLYEETPGELVFKIPTGVIPTSFKPHPAPAAIEEPAEPEPQPAQAPAPAAAEAMNGFTDRPITLQFPKQTVSVEQALAILNKAKIRLGNNLRFTIEEGGYLSAVHRIGK
jgi:hypothetical protein